MSVVDLHPEELLDRDARGMLDAAERTRLQSHLSRCAACRLERMLRADFAAEREAEIPLERLLGLGALGSLGPSPGSSPRADSHGPARAPRRRRAKVMWLLAAAALLVGGAAAATNGLDERRWFGIPATPSTPPADARTSEAPRPKARRTIAVDPPPETTAAPEPSKASGPPPRTPTRTSITPRAMASPPVTVIGPAELFDAASAARRHGDEGRVLDVDRDLEARFPTSREAQVLRAVIGRILLDRGDPTGALTRFDSYLAMGGGELSEDAMVGRAMALDRLGRIDEATRAWSALVQAFPSTPYAAHARARLENQNGR